jgi:hypothetical protein
MLAAAAALHIMGEHLEQGGLVAAAMAPTAVQMEVPEQSILAVVGAEQIVRVLLNILLVRVGLVWLYLVMPAQYKGDRAAQFQHIRLEMLLTGFTVLLHLELLQHKEILK